MRPFVPLALTLLLAAPTLAQQTGTMPSATPPASATPAAPATPMPDTPTSPAAPPAAPVDPVLAIPVPANARVRLDFDTRGDDLLGIFKNFLKGFNGDSILGSLDATRAARAPKAGVVPQGPVQISPALQRLADEADLGLLLKDVNHVHMVVMEVPSGPARPALRRTPGDLASPALPGAALQDLPKMLSFYETTFVGQGGHRILWADADADGRVLMVGFSRGYALVVQTPGILVALRADGYPDPEGEGPLLSLSAAQLSAALSEFGDMLPASMRPGH